MSEIHIVKRKILVGAVITTLLLISLQVFPVSATDIWAKPRFLSDTIYDQRIENASTDGKASIGIGVHIWEYDEQFYPQEDALKLRISIPANTRVGIQYDIKRSFVSGWHDVSELTGITMHNSGTWLDLPFYFIFYGVKYERVWVCSNGFLSFDSESTSPIPQSIPSTGKPNSLVAPFWRDLNPEAGGSITYGTINEAPYRLFVISWNDVPNYWNGIQQSFQVVIAELNTIVPDILKYHNSIWFNYKSITTDYWTTVGVEDQVGDKGSSYNYASLDDDSSLIVENPSPGYRLSRLTIKLSKSDGDAMITISRTEDDLGGYNVILKVPERDLAGELFVKGITGAASLLITGHAGIMFGIMVITMESALMLAQALSPPVFDAQDAGTNQSEAYVTSVANSEEFLPYGYPFDATLGANVLWRFTDPNTEDHSLTIKSEAEYFNLQTYAAYTVSTSVSLNMYINDPPATPQTPYGPTVGYEYVYYSYNTSTTDPNGDDVSYEFDWGDGTNTTTAMQPSGATVGVSHYWSHSGKYNVRARAMDYYGSWSDWSPNLTVSLSNFPSGPPPYPGGGGCPFVYVWDGTGYAVDNNIVPASELSNGTDVEDYYRLEQTPVTKNGKYSLLLTEFENEHSYIDQVKLLAVDHKPNVNIAVTQSGEILTYKNPAPPISATDNNGTDRLNEISLIEGNVSDPNTYFFGEPGDYLTLDFGQVSSDNAKLILRTDYKKHVECILVQVKDGSSWQTVEVLVPRAYWSTQAVNLSPYVIPGQELWVRLYWKYPHGLDFVGLDTTKQADYEVHTANLVSAVHSTQGDVKALLMESDDVYAELVSGQQIQLEFTLPHNAEEARTYILYSEGHYYTIT